MTGATNTSLTITNAQTTNAGNYSVVVTNVAGSVTSSNAVLALLTAPSITIQPTNQTAVQGGNVTFSVTATGTAPLNYQWRFNTTNLLIGATNSTLIMTNVQTTNAGNYSVVVTNVIGSATSSNAVLTVNVPPTITTQPTNQTVRQGSNAVFTVTAAGTAPLSYRWLFNGTNMTGATNTSLTITNAQTTNAGNYSVVVTNVAGSVTSSIATLTILLPPIITVPPTNQIVLLGGNATLAVTATGVGTLSYQWQKNGLNLNTNSNVSGVNTNSLTLTSVKLSDSGLYSVIVSNIYGQVTSLYVTLRVFAPSTVVAWGDDSYGQIDIPDGQTEVVAVSGGEWDSLALEANGTVAAWGSGDYGQTGVPTTLTNAVAISAGWYHSMALNGDGTVTAWGDDTYGQLNIPTGLSNVVAIAAGSEDCLALLANGTVVLWGGYNSLPTGLTNVVAIADGDNNSLALKANGTVVAWGSNKYGEATVPAGLTNVVAIAEGQHHSLALKNNGTVVAWGDNTYGQTNVPTGLTNVLAITAGGYFSVALEGNGAMVAWGDDSAGQCDIPGGLANVVTVSAGGFHGLALNEFPPSITTQPQSQAIALNGNATFAVTATGTGPLSYQWLYNGASIPGQTNTALTINNVQYSNAGNYSVVVTNVVGSVTSSNAVLTVLVPLTISITNPVNNAFFLLGSSINLGASVSDADGTVTQVQFFQGTNSLGFLTSPPYSLVWTNPPAGTYVLMAVATDNNGLVVTSAVVNAVVKTLLADMLSWWRAEGNALDSVGNNHGIPVGGVTYAAGEVGQAFNFDGFSGFIATSVQINNPQNFSLELWFKTTTTQGGVLVGFGDSQFNSPGSYDRNLYMDNNGQLHFGVYNSDLQMADSTASYNDGSWHHAAATISTNTGSCLYVDGVLVASNQLATTAQNMNGWWRIGQNNLSGWPSEPSSYYFNGLIDEVSIYNDPLGAADIQSIYNTGCTGKAPNLSVTLTNPVDNAWFLTGSNINLGASVSDAGGTVTQFQFRQGNNVLGIFTNPPYALVWTNPPVGSYTLTAIAGDNNGLVATSAVNITVKSFLSDMVSWWRAEGNGLDSLGNNDGHLQGGAGFTNGVVGQAFSFNGNNNCGLYIADFTGLTNGNAPHSIEGWIKIQALPSSRAWMLLLGSTSSGSENWLLNADGSTQLGVLGGAQAGPILPVGVWMHLALTFDGQTLSCYTNGVLQSAQPATFNLPASPSLILAVPEYADQAFNGLMDEFSVYSRALTPNEITAIYNAGSGGKAFSLSVTLTNPANNTVILAGSNISLGASTWDPSGTVSLVQFFQGMHSLGVVSNSPYTLVWTNPPVGSNVLTAAVIDSLGRVTNSPAVNVVIDMPPTVALISPTNNAVISTGAPFNLTASAADTVGTVTQVQFFCGTNYLGAATSSPYSFLWQNPVPGTCSLTAVATDNNGLSTVSPAVNIIVDVPPTVALTNPVNNTVFISSLTNLALAAVANDSDGTVAQVQFFQGTNSLGIVTSSPYGINWPNVPTGNYFLTAVATDSNGLSSTSAVVNVVVTPLSVAITNPVDSSIFIISPTNIFLAAVAADVAGNITQVEFFQGTNSLGIVAGAPYGLVWNNVPSGNYALTAVATDNNGLMATSSIVNVYITSLFTTNNLALWLSADALAGLGNGASVATWPDLSGWNNNAYQNNFGNQPLCLTNLLNGHSVVHFNGTNNYLNLPGFMSGATAGEAFVVLRSTQANGSLWCLGSHGYWIEGGVTPPFYPGGDGSITEDFGSANMYNLGVPAQPLNQYNVYEVTSQATNWAAWIDGQLLFQTNNNPVGFAGPPLTFGQNYFPFGGDVAEVLVFNRGLTTDERTTVNNYLNGKYGFVPAVPAAPGNLTAVAISPTQINLTWDELLNGGATQIGIERATTSNGVFSVIAQVNSTLSYLDTNLTAGTTYYYRIRAINLQAWSAYSGVAEVTTPGTGSAMPVSNLQIWLKADTGLLQGPTNTPVNLWVDQSGNGNNATQPTAINQPVWVPGAIGDRPVVHFNGTNNYLNLPGFMSGATAGEAFVVLRSTQANGSLWCLGSHGYWIEGGVTPPFYPGGDGSITEDFGSANMYNLGVPAQPLNQYNVYEVTSQATNWAAWIDGQLLFQTNNNPVGFAGPPLTFGQNYFPFGGDVAEVLVFNRGLTTDERTTVNNYLNGKYGLNMTTPPTPSNLVATAISSTQISLSWNEPLNNYTQIIIERTLASNGVFTVIAQVSNTLAYLDVHLTPGTTYYYRVQATNQTQFQVPYSSYSSMAQATTSTNGSTLPFDSLTLWLRAGVGVWTNTSGQINLWADQSGNGNNANQTTANSQPVCVSAALNGCPVVHFDGAHSFMYLPNFMSAATGGVAFVVLRAVPDYPRVIQSLWEFGGDTWHGKAYPDTDGSVRDDFGSSATQSEGVPTASLTDYHIYEVSSFTNDWEVWFNRVLSTYNGNNTPSFAAGPFLGMSPYERYICGWFQDYAYFAGDIAEILVFDRNLTTAERMTVSSYLNGKYSLVPPVPDAPSNLLATSISPNQISLSWDEQLNGGVTQISIERLATNTWTYQVIAQISDATSYVDTNVAPGTTYYYRLRAVNAQWSDYCNVAQATTPLQGTGLPFDSLKLWLKADSGLLQDNPGTPVNLWADQSGNQNHVTQPTAAYQPIWVPNALGNHPAVQFNGLNNTFNVPHFLDGSASAEAFVVLKVTGTNTDRSLWEFGGDLSDRKTYPDTDGTIRDDFGSTTVHTVGIPTQPLTEYHVYEVSSQPYDWLAWINGGLMYEMSETDNNTVDFSQGMCIGHTSYMYDDGFEVYMTDSYFNGEIAEMLVFNRSLTDAERETVNYYLNAKYGLVPPMVAITNPSNNAVLAGPGNFTITATANDSAGIKQVQFFSGSTSLGIVTNSPYSLVWSNVALGGYALTACATDNNGLVATSTVVNVTVAGIAITSPSNNTVLTAPANISISATVADAAGVSQVEFFAGSTSLGVVTNVPYNLAWNNVPSGAYALTAVATDNFGQSLTSSVVNVTVDVPPTVTLTNPAAGARFVAGTNISLAASASDADGTIAQVEFFSGATSLGVVTSAPYSLVWTNVPSGAWALTARATDNSGLVSTSAVVNIMVAGIALTSPANNLVLTAPASVTISAAVTDNVGISQVQFFQGATSLGIVTSAPYSLVWTNVTSGVYALTAVATDNSGLVFASSVVNVIVDADPTNTDRDGDGVSDYLEYLEGRNPLGGGAVPDTGGIINLQIYTPMQ
jgi:hypothetical protein